jgi:hypothetical protein
MRKQFCAVLSLLVLASTVPALAAPGERGHDWPRANQGQIPIAPERRDPRAEPEAERRDFDRWNNSPHVEGNHWYGHDAPGDARYRLERPFARGRFEHFGPTSRYGVVKIDRNLHRFWFGGGFFFEVAAWDWPICDGWCWDCGDDFVVYEDVDHVGWYLLYNIHTGAYVHVQYLGT